MNELVLTGLDGGNPLGFLAALGTLRILSRPNSVSDIRMSWQAIGSWRPVLHFCEKTPTPDELVKKLQQAFPNRECYVSENLASNAADTERTWRGKLKFSREAYRQYLTCCGQTQGRESEYAATWGSDAWTEVDKGKSRIQKSVFDFTSGQQQFLTMMFEIIERSTIDDVKNALFQSWDYSSPPPSLRWDPLDEGRRYALHAFDPTQTSKNPIRCVRGANRLAIEGLPMLPAIPVAGGTVTTGMIHSKRATYWSWPIWSGAIDYNVIRSLLGLSQIHKEIFDRSELAKMGICEVYRSSVVKPTGRYRNFTPAQPV